MKKKTFQLFSIKKTLINLVRLIFDKKNGAVLYLQEVILRPSLKINSEKNLFY